MPNKISLDDVKKKLPPFVTIKEETYRGTRYSADFIDTEYGEEFTANVAAVIKLQHGCKSRANMKRSETGKKVTANGSRRDAMTPIENVKAKLPAYLTIDESTYQGVREKASFTDTEYHVTFEALVCNMLRGKGQCRERKIAEFPAMVKISIEDVKKRVFTLYGDRIKLIESTWTDTNSVCQWEKDGKLVSMPASTILSGKALMRRELEDWRDSVLERDSCQCKRCGASRELVAHHILTFSKYPKHRLDVNNGITLCQDCHNGYHSKFKNVETPENLLDFLSEKE